MTSEKRSFSLKYELRAKENGKTPVLSGHAAVFNSPSMIDGWFIETIAPGAFTQTISDDDIRCLFNHEDEYVLGRKSSGTLRLSEDNVGLAIECDPPDTQTVRDLVLTPIERGDIDGMSFGFFVIRDDWDWSGPVPKRTILQAQVYEVSIVTFPAYADTDIAVRSLLNAAGIDGDKLAQAVTRSKKGDLNDQDADVVIRSIEVLSGIAGKAQVRPSNGDAAQVRARLEMLKKRADLAGLD